MLRRTSLALAACGTVVVALTGAGLAAARSDDGGYPQRIGFERPSPPLPPRPGQLAATMHDNAFGSGRWVGLTANGEMYDLPPFGPNRLSPDGRLLLTAEGDWDDARLAVHDLTTGTVRTFDDVVQQASSSDLAKGELRLDTSRPVHWSPDGAHIIASFRGGRSEHAYVLDVRSGERVDVGTGAAAGFLGTGEAVTVQATGEDQSGAPLTATAADVATGTVRRTLLGLDGPWSGAARSGAGASVSPTGTLVLLEDAGGGDATVRLFALQDGRELPSRRVEGWDGCGVGWLDDDPVVPTSRGGALGSRIASVERVGASGSRPLVAVHFRMQSSCLQPTTLALQAGPRPTPWGTSTALWTWYWRQLLLACIATLVLLALALRSWRWRRSLRAPSERMRVAHRRAAGL